MLDLTAIRNRHASSTEGEWYATEEGRVYSKHSEAHNEKHRFQWTYNSHEDVGGASSAEGGGYYMADEDAEFIAHAHQDVPVLLAVIERLVAEAIESLPIEPQSNADPRIVYKMTREQAYAAWQCKICDVRRDEHADQPVVSAWPDQDITDHLFEAKVGD